MRMWNVPVNIMCDRHLLGEHCECHTFVGTIKKGISIRGYLDNSLLETFNLKKRHDELALEMSFRRMNHNSPLIYEDKFNLGNIDSKLSLTELMSRCIVCKKRCIEMGTLDYVRGVKELKVANFRQTDRRLVANKDETTDFEEESEDV